MGYPNLDFLILIDTDIKKGVQFPNEIIYSQIATRDSKHQIKPNFIGQIYSTRFTKICSVEIF